MGHSCHLLTRAEGGVDIYLCGEMRRYGWAQTGNVVMVTRESKACFVFQGGRAGSGEQGVDMEMADMWKGKVDTESDNMKN